MQRGREAGRSRPPDPADTDGARHSARSDEIHLRSYDRERSYDLDVVVVDQDGNRVLERQYHLWPGRVTGESDILPAGDYEVRVVSDDGSRETLRCRLDSAPAHTAVVEVGNGVLSLTGGLCA
jgi:hypothetical protein